MMTTRKCILPIAAALLLAACSNDKPSNALFEKTINQFAEKEGVCLPLVLNMQNPRTPDLFNQIPLGLKEIKIAEKDKKGNKINKTALKQLDLLEDEGFYDKSREDMALSPKSDEKINVSVYTLTEKGMKQIRGGKDDPRFCIGHQKVEKIKWYTEPSPSNGMTVSRVSYEARFVPENWVGDLLKAGGGSKLPLEEVRTQSATLVKTSDGWKDSRELR